MHEYKFPQQTFYHIDYDKATVVQENGFILNEYIVIVERDGKLVSSSRVNHKLTEKAAAKELLKVARAQVAHFKDNIKYLLDNKKKQAKYDESCVEQWQNSLKLWEGLVPTKKKKPK